MSEQKTLTLEETLQQAEAASRAGVPVDWKELCFRTYNVGLSEVRRLNGVIAGLERKLQGGEE